MWYTHENVPTLKFKHLTLVLLETMHKLLETFEDN